MPGLLWTPQSRADLVEILLYIRRDNRLAAVRFLAAVNTTAAILAAFPGSGARRDELSLNLRSFPIHHYNDYLIFYRTTLTNSEVIRLLHGSRDLHRLFGQN